MRTSTLPAAAGPRKAAFFSVCLALELIAFAILPLSSYAPPRGVVYAQACLAACLLVGTLCARRVEAAAPYSHVLHALFAGSTAVLISALLGGRTLEAMALGTVSPAWIALSKLSEMSWRVATILLLMVVGGASLRSMFLVRGRLGLGLGVGLSGLAVAAALACAPILLRPGGGSQLLLVAPWILVFALADGFGEELLFRGLFLRRFEPFLGKGWSNILTAVAYTLLRAPAIDAPNVAVCLVLIFPLALAWGRLMQKTGSLWGSALFHAGVDCFLILGLHRTL